LLDKLTTFHGNRRQCLVDDAFEAYFTAPQGETEGVGIQPDGPANCRSLR
jgi:hypothetical protein